ncbi:MAG TPA: orotidine-5'-phosphate decarboxylase [Spirochaetota bacterium]|nr:orotidine-5'-phosphate decarboxylase [Spirochaetota bacterium]HPS86805.1 orotidine-5'-phosphate decarboxylase [Spirochaetota bacterium]
MNYLDMLKNSSIKFSSIVCMGLDPVIEDIPETDGTPGERIFVFYEKILNKHIQKNIFPGAVKPNYAFYAQYGIDGIISLEKIIKIYKSAGIPVILDYKRGDIGKTAKAYAKEAFIFFDADSVTLSPYLGYDSIEPYIKDYPDKGYYILTKTSNSSSGEIQDIKSGDKEMFLNVAELIVKWFHPGIGSVAGATYPEQLEKISDIFISSGKEIPFLIPGVGAQGGSIEEVVKIIKRSSDIGIHRINASSSLNYAYKTFKNMKYDEASAEALKQMNDEINTLR